MFLCGVLEMLCVSIDKFSGLMLNILNVNNIIVDRFSFNCYIYFFMIRFFC